jgi:hypothetical protein
VLAHLTARGFHSASRVLEGLLDLPVLDAVTQVLVTVALVPVELQH